MKAWGEKLRGQTWPILSHIAVSLAAALKDRYREVGNDGLAGEVVASQSGESPLAGGGDVHHVFCPG